MVFKIAIFPFQCGVEVEKWSYLTQLENTSDFFVTFPRLRNAEFIPISVAMTVCRPGHYRKPRLALLNKFSGFYYVVAYVHVCSVFLRYLFYTSC